MNMQPSPTIGIGLPVYNNEKYLEPLLKCLLNQTYQQITIYISDDYSNDATESICRRYADADERIVYHRNASNIGANANNKQTLKMAETEYFMFSRGHELMTDNLVAECLKTLLANPGASLSFCETKWIDENDELIENKPIAYTHTVGLDVAARCAIALWGNWDCYYGLSKTALLRNIRANQAIIGNDTLSLFEKALIGGFAHAAGGTRYRRYLYSGETSSKRMQRYQQTTHKNLSFIDKLFPLAKLPFYLLTSISRAKIPFSRKLLILLILLFNAPIRYLVSRRRAL